MALTCWNCGKQTGIEGKPFRNDHCPACQADLRSCRGCRFYDPQSAHQCLERVNETVKIKDKSNFCDYFQPRMIGAKVQKIKTDKSSRKKAFDDLFDE
ncbi:MAG: hypothetical protein KAR42_00570 [candidate division Zixibacteria bacterium]|nr:hypothetical protein [candidate division Zixibacteria bacterium]